MNSPPLTAAARFVGQSVKRREDPRLLTGHGRFADDITLPRQLHIAFLRSDVPAGRLRGIDTTAAEALPGVRAVLTGADVNHVSGPLWTSTVGLSAFGPPMLPLAGEDVRFVGDPIALVVASSRYIAEDACELIEVDIDPTPAVATLEQALAEGAATVHAELGTNLVSVAPRPDPELDEILATAPHVITHTVTMSRTTNVPMEGRGLVASWEQYGGELRIWPSTQNPHEIKAFAARVLGIAENRVRVEFGDVGGGFGQKMYPTREEAAVLLAARAVAQPVKWIEDRRENLLAANQARHDIATLTMAIDCDGRFLAATFDLLEDAGCYPVGGGTGSGARLVAMMFTGPYRIPKTGFSCKTVFTNTCGKAPYRGPWAIETIAREQTIDAVARHIAMDPLELRRRNIVRRADLPFTLPTGLVYDAVTSEETLEQAVHMLGWEPFRAQQKRARSEGRCLGVGLSVCVEPSAMSRATEQATVRMDPSGKVEVLVGTGSHGQGLETTIPQVVADYLGCAFQDVVLRQGGDTPYGPGTGGSRSAVIASGAAQTAATALRGKVIVLAAHLLEASPHDLEVADSTVSVRGTPTKALSFAQLARTTYLEAAALPSGVEAPLEASRRYAPPTPFTWSNACHLCVCEVDPQTGVVTLLRYIVSEDCGVMINPMIVDGQIAGGVAQGIGGALYEEMAYDRDGNPLATTFLDYLIPTANEVPEIEYGHIQTPSDSVGGHKGMGEGGAIASPAAVANAVNDALGAMLAHFPMTPERVLQAIERSTTGVAEGRQ